MVTQLIQEFGCWHSPHLPYPKSVGSPGVAIPIRDVKTYQHANNVGVKKSWVKSLQTFMLFCQESE